MLLDIPKLDNHDYTIVISGEAGQGLATIEALIVKTLSKTHYVYSTKDVMSRVRGGNNTVEIRVSTTPVASYKKSIDLLFLLNNNAFYRLPERLHDKTVIVGEEHSLSSDYLDQYGSKFQVLPIKDLGSEAGSVLFSNTILYGLIIGLFNGSATEGNALISDKFSKKSTKIIEGNLKAFEVGYDIGHAVETLVEPSPTIPDYKILNGTDAISIGALAGGCDMIASYPMSPATGVLEYLARKSGDFNVAVEQAEDEIAALNMVIGGWYAGARALATTSGGGFALMEEAVSLSGITETPFVLHLAQRPGPGTGLPTRTGQEDLNLVVYSGHGEFPRIVLAPGTPEDGVTLTARAFYLADKYQVPVFVLSDQYYLDSKVQMTPPELDNGNLERFVSETDFAYKRYDLSTGPISPRGIPANGEGIVRCDSDEHDEHGMITEDFTMRIHQNDKRLGKTDLILEDYIEPVFFGNENYEHLLVAWGSNYGVLKEFILSNPSYGVLFIKQLFPLSPTLKPYFEKAKEVSVIENNATGQLADLLKLNLDVTVHNKVLQYDGRPFAIDEIGDLITKEV